SSCAPFGSFWISLCLFIIAIAHGPMFVHGQNNFIVFIGRPRHLFLTTICPLPLPSRFRVSFFASQHSFISTTTSAGRCAHYTISGAGSCYLPVRHNSPTRLLRPTTLLPKALGVTIFFQIGRASCRETVKCL